MRSSASWEVGGRGEETKRGREEGKKAGDETRQKELGEKVLPFPGLGGLWVGADKCPIMSVVLLSFLPTFPTRPCAPCRQGPHPVSVFLHCPAE